MSAGGRVFTAAETRRYLCDDNGWTDAEVDQLFAEVGEHERTDDEWTQAAEDFNRRHPE